MPAYPTPSIVQGTPVPIEASSVSAVRVDGCAPSEKPKVLESDAAMSALKQQHDWMWSHGLSATVARSVAAHPLRIVVLDNSGSMGASDGKRLVHHSGSMKTLQCTRWQELADDAVSLAKMSEALVARTDFMVLNPAPGLNAMSVCTDAFAGGIRPRGATGSSRTLQRALETNGPRGSTPLTEAVMSVVSMIEPVAPRLRADGQAVAVLICTDGLPNDQHTFLQAMRLLQTLPVWCVVRLITDDDAVVDYWNDLDKALEAPLEVLDDVRGEALEVAKLNPWLTYAPPLHMARLFGLPDKLFDALDEQALLPSQISAFVQMLLGCDELPEPELQPAAFLEAVSVALRSQPPAYDPRSGRMKPWLDLRALERALHRRGQPPGLDCAIM